jgi:hypothetical protein
MKAKKVGLSEAKRGMREVGGKKLAQKGTEFSHKIKETRRHRSGGRRGGRPHHAG